MEDNKQTKNENTENMNTENMNTEIAQEKDEQQNNENPIDNPLQEQNDKQEKTEQDERDVLLKKTEELNKQLSELNDKYIRLLAEFDNYKKRTRKEKENLLKYAGEEVWKSILPIIDDFERAIKENQNTEDIEVVKKGFDIIFNKIKHIITQNKLTAIDCLHKEFNADIMEAVAKVPAPSEDMKGKVIEELEKAYQLDDKIIRYAKVIVGE